MPRIPLATRDQVADKEKPAYDAFMASRQNRPNVGPYSLLMHMPEMAQRLEAALRRPSGETVAPPVAPESPPARPCPRWS